MSPSEQDLLRRKARQAVANGLRGGHIQRGTKCAWCGEMPSPGKDGRSRLEAHHCKGYDYPLSIQWVCARCHRKMDHAQRGQSNNNAKLTTEQVREIRREYPARSAPDIAREYGVTSTAIYDIISGRSWNSI